MIGKSVDQQYPKDIVDIGEECLRIESSHNGADDFKNISFNPS